MTCRRRAGLAALAAAAALSATADLAPPAAAEGLRVLPAITRSVGDQRRIAEGSRVSLRVVRPQLDIVPGREAGDVVGLSANDDRSLLLVVLADGSVRLWDLDGGVQLGGALGGDAVGGAIRGAGRASEAVVLGRDGALAALRPDGTRPLGAAAAPGRAPAPVFSADGGTVAFRAADGGWRVAREGRTLPLADAAPAFPPVVSRDGTRLVYRMAWGALAVLDSSQPGAAAPGGCRADAAVTAGAFAPDGERIVLGDEEGTICAWRLTARGAELFFVQPRAHAGPVRAVAFDPGGDAFASRGDGRDVRVWSLAAGPDPVASFDVAPGASGPLLLDAARQWVLVGERRGTVGVHAWAQGDAPRIARLFTTNDGGWAVLDRAGRFDGPQNGTDALLWAGEGPADTLPVDAFTEGWFEPGLLAALDADAPRLLTADAADLADDGYAVPPAVSIDPIDAGALDREGRAPVTVRLVDPDYPPEALAEVRLYRDGKLVPPDRARAGDGTFEYRVLLSPGANRFAAVGVGPRGVESMPAEAVAVAPPGPAPRPRMRVVAIGIDDYVRPGWKLSYSRNDARAIVSALRDRGGRLFGGVDPVMLLDAEASASAIEERIAWDPPSPHDVLVVYFSGHGYSFRGETGWEWYLLPYTGAWNAAGAVTESMVRRHGVSSRILMRTLTGSRASRVFLILDSCRSGALVEAAASGAFEDAVGRKALRRMARVGGIHVLAASRADQDAVELRTVPHGALTWLLLQALDGAADDNADGSVSVREIVDYTIREMPLLSRRLAAETIGQVPVGYSRFADFPLARL